MHHHRHLLWIVIPAALLSLTGCDDSKNPLSDPQTSKPDERLIGVWREQGTDGQGTYYHVGRAGEKFPAGMLRIVEITLTKGKLESPVEYLAYPTVLGDKTYLNVVLLEPEEIKRLGEKGWNADAVDSYTFLKYQVDGDKLLVWLIDDAAKKRAITEGKIKGVIVPNKPAMFTDTADKVARFVAEAGDGLWDMKNPERLERVVGRKR